MAYNTHRFAEDTETSKQAWVWVTAILALTYSTLMGAIRIAVKRRLWGIDDTVLAVAHVCTYNTMVKRAPADVDRYWPSFHMASPCLRYTSVSPHHRR